MTNDELRVLDAEVAEKVMGLRVEQNFGDYIVVLGEEVGERGPSIKQIVKLPAYSTDIKAAWQAIEHWNGDVNLRRQNGFWRCEIFRPSYQCDAWSDAAPLAICLALLDMAKVPA